MTANGVGSRPFSSSGTAASLSELLSSPPGRSAEVLRGTFGAELAISFPSLRATSCSRTLSNEPIFSLISLRRCCETESSAGARKRQSRENLLQFVHGCSLSHFSFLRRHSRQEVIIRFRRRTRF